MISLTPATTKPISAEIEIDYPHDGPNDLDFVKLHQRGGYDHPTIYVRLTMVPDLIKALQECVK